jgi:hypothetical protein
VLTPFLNQPLVHQWYFYLFLALSIIFLKIWNYYCYTELNTADQAVGPETS